MLDKDGDFNLLLKNSVSHQAPDGISIGEYREGVHRGKFKFIVRGVAGREQVKLPVTLDDVEMAELETGIAELRAGKKVNEKAWILDTCRNLTEAMELSRYTHATTCARGLIKFVEAGELEGVLTDVMIKAMSIYLNAGVGMSRDEQTHALEFVDYLKLFVEAEPEPEKGKKKKK